MPSFERFVSPEYALEAEVEAVPHIGEKAALRLADKGIHTTYQLVGAFLKHKRDRARFTRFLVDHGVYEQHAPEAAKAIDERVSRVGIKLHVSVPKDIVASSRITDDQAKAFQKRALSGRLEEDFQSMGFGQPGRPSGSVAALKSKGIASTDELIGEFLSQFDGAPSESMAVRFYERLGELGAAHGYKATICEAIKLKLDVGLGQTTAPRNGGLATQVEDEADFNVPGSPTRDPYPVQEPRSDVKSKHRSRVPAPEKPSASAVSAEGSSSSPFAVLALIGLALGVLALTFLGDSGARSALPAPSVEPEGVWV